MAFPRWAASGALCVAAGARHSAFLCEGPARLTVLGVLDPSEAKRREEAGDAAGADGAGALASGPWHLLWASR